MNARNLAIVIGDRRQAYCGAWVPGTGLAAVHSHPRGYCGKSILSALTQLELSAHIEHTKEMRSTVGVVIDCKEAINAARPIGGTWSCQAGRISIAHF
jgi:hypothetical protein